MNICDYAGSGLDVQNGQLCVNFWELPWQVLNYWFGASFGSQFCQKNGRWSLEKLGADALRLQELCGFGLRVDQNRLTLDLPLQTSPANAALELRLLQISESLASAASLLQSRIEQLEKEYHSLKQEMRDLRNRCASLGLLIGENRAELEEIRDEMEKRSK